MSSSEADTHSAEASCRTRQRLHLRATGIVQGVGFRPTVYRIAQALELGGFVRNEADGVAIEVEGGAAFVARFAHELRRALRPPARIDTLATCTLPPTGENQFRIRASDASANVFTPAIPPDLAPCDACLAEMRDPGNRRRGHAFVSCVGCGPRYSVMRGLPYDRRLTTMASFPLCAECAGEYGDPADRRFHAEPIACPSCGPRLSFRSGGAVFEGDAALDAALRALRQGAIVAVKGVGGYVLAADATDEDAVARLRERKRRPHKPFAVLVRDLAHAETVGQLDPCAWNALRSSARPIVIVPRKDDAPLAPSVAPGLRDIGLFLPPSPLQQLLADRGPPLLVMTSGNVSDEPIAFRDAEALLRLAAVADAFLLHDRAIERRTDDSVVRPIGGHAVPIRRARGYVPQPVRLATAGPAVLAVGGGGKNTVCLARGRDAWLSAHIGDLDHPEGWAAFRETVVDLQRMLGVSPVVVAHDLHPDLPPTRWAERSGLRRIGVQHHHAHLAACLAEHGMEGPALGVIFDGTGYGADGTLWGGEFLVGGLRGFERLAHLVPLPLPGGEAAIRAPWRAALAALHAAGESADLLVAQGERERAAVAGLLRSDVACPRSTGAGRWFDAVAALCGLCSVASYDGQAAMLLEAAAAREILPPYPFELQADDQVDLRPTIRAIARDLRHGVYPGAVAARFHETVAAAIDTCCARLLEAGAPRLAVLSGGCFQNRRLTERTAALLTARGFHVLQHRQVPPNDGGLALGQAAIASQLLAREG